MLWVTREHVHVDRVACPWLIKNFVDKNAEFKFVARDVDPASIKEGIVFDMKDVELGHHGDDCSFDSIIKKYNLTDDPALKKVQYIVNLADNGKEDQNPLAFALDVFARGYRLSSKTDHETLEKEFYLYDALYAFYVNENSK